MVPKVYNRFPEPRKFLDLLLVFVDFFRQCRLDIIESFMYFPFGDRSGENAYESVPCLYRYPGDGIGHKLVNKIRHVLPTGNTAKIFFRYPLQPCR